MFPSEPAAANYPSIIGDEGRTASALASPMKKSPNPPRQEHSLIYRVASCDQLLKRGVDVIRRIFRNKSERSPGPQAGSQS
jgi:hypothetical protein